ncbi:MAG: right-handed parallel beta-helix repeat-containing protein [Planctomycetota bacterium]
MRLLATAAFVIALQTASTGAVLLVPEDYPTIGDAVAASSDGDLVLVGPGTYLEAVDFGGKQITIRSDADRDEATYDPDPAATTIDATGLAASAVMLFGPFNDRSPELVGFTVTGGSGTYFGSRPYPAGGGIYIDQNGGTFGPVIRSCIVSGNRVVGDGATGGGIEVCYGTSPGPSYPEIIDCLIMDNHADYSGGGIALDTASSSCHIWNCTIVNNSAGTRAGGLDCHHATIDIRSCIIWGNTAGASPQIWFDDEPTVSFSDIQAEEPWPGEGNIHADPEFVDSGAGDCHLLLTSPCIDAGDPANQPCTGKDLLGSPRYLDGDLDREQRIDMGALEFDNVHLDISGDATPGGTMIFTITGTPHLLVLLFIGSNPGEACLYPCGPLFFDFASPWWVFFWGGIPVVGIYHVPVTVPYDVPVPISLVFQNVAFRDAAGNTSNPLRVVIE